MKLLNRGEKKIALSYLRKLKDNCITTIETIKHASPEDLNREVSLLNAISTILGIIDGEQEE